MGEVLSKMRADFRGILAQVVENRKSYGLAPMLRRYDERNALKNVDVDAESKNEELPSKDEEFENENPWGSEWEHF